VVKSISLERSNLELDAFSQVQAPAARAPQAQRSPEGLAFSADARSQLHSPAGRARHEQRGPAVAFSEDALSHVQRRADCLPHEHLACWAQMHSPPPWLQQVEGFTTWVAILSGVADACRGGLVCFVLGSSDAVQGEGRP